MSGLKIVSGLQIERVVFKKHTAIERDILKKGYYDGFPHLNISDWADLRSYFNAHIQEIAWVEGDVWLSVRDALR